METNEVTSHLLTLTETLHKRIKSLDLLVGDLSADILRLELKIRSLESLDIMVETKIKDLELQVQLLQARPAVLSSWSNHVPNKVWD